MAISRKDVEHVAKLARLELGPDDLAAAEKQLGAILGYIDTLKGLDVSRVEPMVHPDDLADVFRPDEPKPSLGSDAALKNAPQAAPPYFVVPRIIEE